MGRETKILLGLLGLLAGVFVGVLSMKLLVPRPPAGAGPDIHDDIAAATPAEIVDPPAFSPPVEEPAAVDPGADRYAGGSAFGRGAESDEPAAAPGEAPRDPFAATTAFAEPEPLAAEAVREAVPLETADETAVAAAPLVPAAAPAPVAAVGYEPPAAPRASSAAYVAAAGDSWWSLAERTYGDGRLYRALFAWNRAINPRVSLVPGTPLELPTRSQLATAWPRLVPRE